MWSDLRSSRNKTNIVVVVVRVETSGPMLNKIKRVVPRRVIEVQEYSQGPLFRTSLGGIDLVSLHPGRNGGHRELYEQPESFEAESYPHTRTPFEPV